MANPQKDKGARFERAALAMLVDLADRSGLSHQLVGFGQDNAARKPRRELGEGRKIDIGDLAVFTDVCVQVKAFNDLVRAIRLASDGAERQRHNRAVPHGLGLAPVPRARATSVNWIFASQHWPADPLGDVLVTGLTSRAVTHVRDETAGPRHERVAVIRIAGKPDVTIGTAEAWVAAYASSVLQAVA